jgi:class 3 adenylate cyclase/CheY-like chemotaxis protein
MVMRNARVRAVNADQVKVLVVDDGRDNREFIVEYVLQPNGFTPLLARDGVEGMEMVRAHEPDVILLDLQMPRMNGMEVLDALHAEGWDIPVILMTFHGSEEVAIEVYRKGVRDYVKKPYTVEEMLESIEHCLGEVRLRREKDALTERLLHANAALNRRIRELNTLYQIGKSVTALVGMEQLLTRIVDAATQVIGAEQGSLLLLEGDQLVCRATKAHNAPQARAANEFSSDQIAWRAARSGQPAVFSPDELRQARAQNPSLPAAVAAVPLRVGERVVGVLSVENVRPDAVSFNQQDAAMLSALGDYAAIAIENARIYAALEEATSRETESIRNAFERYVAPSVVERVLQSPDSMLKLGGRRREISVVFADVRGFTTYSEHAPPEEVVNLLNEYFSLATDVIFSREGTLDKFLGDAVMSIFNAPEDQDDHPYRAVDAAMALQRAIAERNARVDGEALTFGIGVHLGEAVVGNVGTAKAMNYTAIGDTVNVAKRLQERALPGQVLISAQVYERLQQTVEVEALGELAIKGRQQPLQVFRLVSLA